MLTVNEVLELANSKVFNFADEVQTYNTNDSYNDIIKSGIRSIKEHYENLKETDAYHFENKDTVLNFIETVFKLELSLIKLNSLQK